MKPLNTQQSVIPFQPAISQMLGSGQQSYLPQDSKSFLVTTQTHPSQSSSQTPATQANNKKSITQIHQLYTQIHSTINDMDNKVQHVIKKHQAQFLFAYRNHIKKIKKQLSQIKYKSQQQQKMFSSNDRIQYLQQELAIFREETMKAYNKLDNKNAEIDVLKMRLKDLEKETSHANNELREQFRKSMVAEMNKNNLHQRIAQLQQQLQYKNNQIQKLTNKLSQLQDNKSSIKPQSTLGSKLFIHQHLKKTQHSRTSPLTKPLLRSPNNRSINSSSIHVTTSNFYHLRSPQSSHIYQNDLKQWFLECIKTVKRQIAHRNGSEKSLELNNIMSIEEFMLVDKLRLLEVFLENQRLLTYMYQKIFPDRLTVLREKLTEANPVVFPKSMVKVPAALTERQQRISSFNQALISDRYNNTQTKMTNLPKVFGRVSEQKQKQSQRTQRRNNVLLKDGKLNLSIL